MGRGPLTARPVEIRTATLRANTSYELVVADRLRSEERALLSAERMEGMYGLLRPLAGCALPPCVVSRDTALLFLTMSTPGAVPEYALREAGETGIAQLVLDGVLEMRAGDAFVSGNRAHDLLLAPSVSAPSGHVVQLSHDALRYGAALEGEDADVVALRLYQFGRRPLTPHLRREFGSWAAVRDALGLAPGGEARSAVDDAWDELPVADDDAPWLSFQRRGGLRREALGGAKLYVSPRLEDMSATMRTVASVLADLPGAAAFKVARDIGGLCRPDKLVCYFARIEDLNVASGALSPDLAGRTAHGVPFTAPIDPDGLLSWGLDRPMDAGSGDGRSWRLRVAQIAAELLKAVEAGEPSARPVWQQVLERLRLRGIDPETWVPTQRAWSS